MRLVASLAEVVLIFQQKVEQKRDGNVCVAFLSDAFQSCIVLKAKVTAGNFKCEQTRRSRNFLGKLEEEDHFKYCRA